MRENLAFAATLAIAMEGCQVSNLPPKTPDEFRTQLHQVLQQLDAVTTGDQPNGDEVVCKFYGPDEIATGPVSKSMQDAQLESEAKLRFTLKACDSVSIGERTERTISGSNTQMNEIHYDDGSTLKCIRATKPSNIKCK
jgi:hypothetical protein